MHYLLDIALPDNRIPRVFLNTGIEYTAITKFVKELSQKDDRFVMVLPEKNIKETLETYGYPFKNKEHAQRLYEYQSGQRGKTVTDYIDGKRFVSCPKILKYQFTEDFKLKVSHKCCEQLKKKPAQKWAKENNKTVTITGMRSIEGNGRKSISCILLDKSNKLKKFHPLVVVSEEFEAWFIDKYNIKLCELYYPPYNFKRTGCKGCTFNLHLQEDLMIMKELLPNEYRQCEIIWKPVYEEYRRIGYRLKEKTLFD